MANEVELRKIAKPIFGITYERYMQLAREEVVPKPERGKIYFIQAAKALIEYYRRLAESHGTLSLSDERKELTAIKKEREKLKLEEDRKNLVPYNEAIKWVSLLVAECKAALWNIPRRLGPVLAVVNDERKCEEILRKEHRKVLEELAKGGMKKGRR